ncbi:PH and SEC7 domain-containing protein 4 isoform X2 [Sorex araneus]|uniref:PH and SEC7 domain-containing protein 4 isoform X2 n=1 Tax=Sorex araneus TaxID=42254 RepID=UPI002433A826|nr:PH and SEC7 domain-containing protein 4 isoform X2 [Sorex araneus]
MVDASSPLPSRPSCLHRHCPCHHGPDGSVKVPLEGFPARWTMGDPRLPEATETAEPTELLSAYVGGGLPPCPASLAGAPCGPSQPPGAQTWALDPLSSARPDASTWGSSLDAPGTTPSPTAGSTSSTQVVFWAGILQAQMCVLDLEEELEKTDGLRAELRRCVPVPPEDLSLPGEEASVAERRSSGPEAGSQPEEVAGLSPAWSAEEESVFFDNPLFLDSPCSDASTSGTCFSWAFPDCLEAGRPEPGSPQMPEALVPAAGELGVPGSELEGEDVPADSGGSATPPFPVPTYKLHSSWAALDASEGAPTAPPSWEEREALPCSPGTLREEDPSWPSPERPLSEDRGSSSGDKNAEGPQESAFCALSPGPWGSSASSPEPNSLESVSRDAGSRSSLVTSEPGSLQPQSPPWDHGAPRRMLDASCPALLTTDVMEPSSPDTEEPEEALDPGTEVTSADPDGTAAPALGLAEDPVPEVCIPEADQRPPTGDKLANGVGPDKGAWNLASRLFHLEGFRKSEVAAYLRKNNDFSRAVAEEYLSFFQFGGQSLDRALRGFLQALVLSGETQERERILYQFSRRFHYCNPGLFSSVDCVHTLTCAIMLLNTDLHGQNIGKSMSCQEFITNLHGLQDGGNFPKELLKALYWSIRSEKLEWAVDEEDAARPEKAQTSSLAGKLCSPLLQLAQEPTAPTYKKGILARKMHHDADGKKTPWGKRGWKMFHTLLRGMVLYFLKGEDCSPEGESLIRQMVDEPVGVHHSLASPATHYTKKAHVFQLRTADWRLYLFQAPTAKEMGSWIARINLAAATHSAPPFPAAVGSQRRFVRPILPMGPAQSSLEEQHRAHENCLDAAADDLLDLQRRLPERRGRSRELEEYRLRKEYLEYEKSRYETYVQLLLSRLHFPDEDLDLWEEQLAQEACGTREPKSSLKKSHSSPSLHQDEAPTTAKVKRNISERRTYRKIIPKRNRNQL